MREVAVLVSAEQRSRRVGNTRGQEARRVQGNANGLKSREHLSALSVLEEVEGRDHIPRPGFGQVLRHGALDDEIPAKRVCDRHLLRADVDAVGIRVAAGPENGRETTLPAPEVKAS